MDIHINSAGGSVTQATAIVAMLSRMDGVQKVAYIDGLAASAASYIAVHADEIIMYKDAWLMIHEPSGGAWGTPESLRSTADALEGMREQYSRAYADRSGKPIEEIREMMRSEKWMNAQEALALGFCDAIADEGAAAVAEALHDMVATCDYRNVPDAFQTPAVKKTGALTLEAETAGIPAQEADTNNNGGEMPPEGMENMDMDTLRREHMPLAEALLREGAQQERARIQALDALAGLAGVGGDGLIAQAKYGADDQRCEASALAMRILQQRAEQDKTLGVKALKDRQEDAAVLSGIGLAPETGLPGVMPDESAKRIKEMAAQLSRHYE